MDAATISSYQCEAVISAMKHHQFDESRIVATLKELNLDNSTKKGRKTKKNSETEKPKRAPTAYNLFLKEHLPIEKQKLLDSGIEKKDAQRQAMASVAQLWKTHKTQNLTETE